MRRAIDSSLRLIDSTRRVVEASKQSAARRPIRTWRTLRRASDSLIEASIRLDVAVCIMLKPERADAAPELLNDATWRWIDASEDFRKVSAQLGELQAHLLESLEQGLIQPEPDEPAADRRPRIRIVPPAIPARSFLIYRRSTARDRIASVPLRRRPTAPAATGDAPRQISRGRAPPSASNCLL
jgi:hypothetical protein